MKNTPCAEPTKITAEPVNRATTTAQGCVIINVVPVPKPRMTQRDKWAHRTAVMKYWRYKDAMAGYKYLLTSEFLMSHKVTFCLPMPSSWSDKKKKEMEGKLHFVKPDLDNLLKGLWDAVLKKDQKQAKSSEEKIWSYDGRILFE